MSAVAADEITGIVDSGVGIKWPIAVLREHTVGITESAMTVIAAERAGVIDSKQPG